jgi:H+/Cl- antiporter ClcA
VGGMIGGAFGASIIALQSWLRRNVHVRHVKTGFAVAFLCGLALVLLRFLDPRALGPGNRLVSDILGGATVANAELVAIRFGSTLVSYLSGCAGGIFAPSLAIGASLGSWISSWWTGTNAVLFALLGMIAVLTGVTRAPFTSFMLIVEMTDRHSAILPMMLTAVTALGSARLFGGLSFYESTKIAILSELQPPPAPPKPELKSPSQPPAHEAVVPRPTQP